MIMDLKNIETKADYKEYENRFNLFMGKEGLNTLQAQEQEPEPYFSWYACDCCDRSLGGDRIDCKGFNPTEKKIYTDYSICMDCYYYAEYGTLDDMTLIEIEV